MSIDKRKKNKKMLILSERIKELRKEKGITQEELAEKIKATDGAISTWEMNKNEPKASYIAELAKYFNVTSDYLLGLENC